MGNNSTEQRALTFVGVLLAFLAIVVAAGTFIVPFLLQNRGSTPAPTVITPAVTIFVVTATPFIDQQVTSTQPRSTVMPTEGAQVTAKVDAHRDWQPTGVQIPNGAKVKIEVTEGQWTNLKGQAPYTTGEGTGYICGKAMKPSDCVEIIPSSPTDALIGRIGNQVFVIGQGTTVTSDQAGELELRMNDGPNDLHDNDGTLTVSISMNS